MALFEWKNGTKVQNAVVTSDGTTVQDAVWEGETPISANNMNQAQKKMQDEYNGLIGDLNDLNTTEKSSVVSSINWLTPTVLFNDENGVQQGNLSESVSLYAKIKMYYKTVDNQFGSEEIYNNGGNSFVASVFKGSVIGTTPVFYAKVGRVLFNDMTFTADRIGNFDIKTSGNNTFSASANAIKILRVEGLEKIGV